MTFYLTKEARIDNPLLDFAVGMGGWTTSHTNLIGQIGCLAGDAYLTCENVRASFAAVRLIVSIGWSIYPLGHLVRYLMGSLDDGANQFGVQFGRRRRFTGTRAQTSSTTVPFAID